MLMDEALVYQLFERFGLSPLRAEKGGLLGRYLGGSNLLLKEENAREERRGF